LEETKRGLLEGGDSTVPWDVQCEPPSCQLRVEDCQNDGGKNGETKKLKKDKKDAWLRPENGPLNIPELLYCYPCCPPDAYKNIKEYYMNTNLNYLCAKNKYVDRDVDLWNIKLMHWTLSN